MPERATRLEKVECRMALGARGRLYEPGSNEGTRCVSMRSGKADRMRCRGESCQLMRWGHTPPETFPPPPPSRTSNPLHPHACSASAPDGISVQGLPQQALPTDRPGGRPPAPPGRLAVDDRRSVAALGLSHAGVVEVELLRCGRVCGGEGRKEWVTEKRRRGWQQEGEREALWSKTWR